MRRCGRCGSEKHVQKAKFFWDTLHVCNGFLCVDCMENLTAELVQECEMISEMEVKSWLPEGRYIYIKER